MRVLVLGAAGMLGNAVYRTFTEDSTYEVFGSLRSDAGKSFFSAALSQQLFTGCDVMNQDSLIGLISKVRPNLVVNCIALEKRLISKNNPLLLMPINSLLPHKLENICELTGARLVHISSDAVFSGDKGNYSEDDIPDARDLYGISKLVGEVKGANSVTIRTSIIGHELSRANGLVEWFLKQEKICNGYSRAMYSGIPTVTLAKIIRDVVVPNAKLSGIYHVASEPISKFDLLMKIAKIYKKEIQVLPLIDPKINRTLKAEKFRNATGYTAPSWEELINTMNKYR